MVGHRDFLRNNTTTASIATKLSDFRNFPLLRLVRFNGHASQTQLWNPNAGTKVGLVITGDFTVPHHGETMLLYMGPCLRISIVKLFAAISSLLILSVILFYYFDPFDSGFSVLNSTTAASDHEIPPIPSDCPKPYPDTPSRQPQAIAPSLSPKDLLCRQVNVNATGIPKLFHQSWKTTELPSKFERWSETCRTMHPDWEWVLWTDDDNHQLVRTYFPWLEEIYLGLPGPIYRADFSRNLYMYMFGGYV